MYPNPSQPLPYPVSGTYTHPDYTPPGPVVQSQSSTGLSPSSFKLADEFRLDPPVVPAALPQQPSTSQRQHDFEVERKIIKECSTSFSQSLLNDVQIEELGGHPPMVSKMIQLGFAPTTAYLAVATISSRDQDQIVDFCKNYERAVGDMGFPPSQVFGALKKANYDLDKAIGLLGVS